MKEGAEILTAKIQRYRPKIAVFNGKGLTHWLDLSELCFNVRGWL